jgi:phage baseplate assembly protein W
MDQRKEFLGRGWAYPVAFDPRKGSVAQAEYEDDVEQAIRIVLGTAPGERVMRPDFGCDIHTLVFIAMDSATLGRVEASVRDALTRYEARIELIDVHADPAEAADGKLLVKIEYRVRLTNQTGNLVYPFYFREGAGQ